MKYRCFKKVKKFETKGGAYWKNSDFLEHLNLTEFQTTYLYLNQKMTPPSKVLEAGCGLGRWIIPLSKKGYNVTGIEIEQEAIDIINTNYKSKNLRIIRGDIFDMPFDDKSYNVVISLGVLEHFKKRSIQEKALAEHKRVLKDDGYFLVTVPYMNLYRLIIHMPYTLIVTIVRKFKGKKQYFSEFRYNKRSFAKSLKRAGFIVLDTIYDDLLPPYNFGLYIDSPLKQLFRSPDGVEYKLNSLGLRIYRSLWKIHPSIISSGIGYFCKKKL